MWDLIEDEHSEEYKIGRAKFKNKQTGHYFTIMYRIFSFDISFYYPEYSFSITLTTVRDKEEMKGIIILRHSKALAKTLED